MWAQILTALLVGLLTAFAFQLLLTLFGVAIGITALDFRFTTPDGATSDVALNATDANIQTESLSVSQIGTFTGLGVLLTINTVLFSACLLATKFSQINDPISGAIVGIVIWSAYLLILTWISSTAVTIFVGSVLGQVTGGFRWLVTTIAAAFGHEEDALDQESAIALIQEEVQQVFNPATLEQSISDALNQKLALVQTSQSSDQAITDQPSPLDTQSREDTTEQLRQKLASYLRQTKPKQLTSEQVHDKLEELLHDMQARSMPQAGSIGFDRAELEKILKQRKEVGRKQRQEILQQIEITWYQVLEAFKPTQSEVTQTEALTFPSGELEQSVDSEGTIDLEAILRHSLPEGLSIAALAATVIQQQLNQIDWKALPERLQRPGLTTSQIEQLATDVKSITQELVCLPQEWTEEYLLPQATGLKHHIIQYTDQLQQTIQNRIDLLKAQAHRRLENTRKAAVGAAWWLFMTAFTTAITAAIAGGLGVRL